MQRNNSNEWGDSMRKGIFWCTSFDTEHPKLMTVSVACDKNGDTKESVQFSSKFGNNFNHKLEWKRLERSVTAGCKSVIKI